MEKKAADRLKSFSKRERKYYDLLMRLRAEVADQFRFHSDEALSDHSDDPDSRATSTHMADHGSDNFRHEIEVGLLTGECETREMIEEAAQRLIDGEYGVCMDCGCLIDDVRLDAKPHAQFCVKCKTARERVGGGRVGRG
jgi:DnaK suppressor protein